MQRSYNQSRRRKEPISAWRWWGVGLVMGAVVSSGFFLSGLPIKWGLLKLPSPEELAAEAKTNTIVAEQKPRFDFYTILPEMEVVVPEETSNNKPVIAAANDESVEPEETTRAEKPVVEEYRLQFGSFKAFEDADQLKAKLVINGVEADIQSVNIQNQAWYRVRSPAYSALPQAERAKQALQQAGVSSILLKLKE